MENLEELEKLLRSTKINLFIKKGSGFLGVLLCTLDFIWDESIPTACTNGKYIKWNPKFFLSLDAETRITVLAHELWHVAYLHMIRLNGRNPLIFNIAADYVINLMLEEHGYYMKGFPYLLDHKYKGWSTEDVYHDIFKLHPDGIPIPILGGDIDYVNGSDNQVSTIKRVVSAVSTARMTNSDPGSIPGEISFEIDNFLNPKLPWETLLYNFFNELSEPEYSFRRPNRRYEDPILPGVVEGEGLDHLIYYLDISGSISDDDIIRFNSEVKFIKDEFNPKKLTLVTFDTEIHDIYTFERDDPFEKIVVTGRGGTDLQEVFKHANEYQPNAMIVFTDMFVDIPADPPKIPIIWICTNNPKAEVPYGKLIHIDSKTGAYKDGLTDASRFTTGISSGVYDGG